MTASSKQAVIVGAGVLGLTSALELRKRGYNVTIIAKDLPHDRHSQAFASPWAGANWLSYAGKDEAQRRRDAITYKKFKELSKELPEEILAFMPYSSFHNRQNDFETYWFGELCGGIKSHPAGQPKTTEQAPYLYEFESLGLNVPRYLEWLVMQLKQPSNGSSGAPVRFLRGTVPTLKAAAELNPQATIVINATGLGAKNLGDVRDEKVYPIRGQTVLVYAPKFRDAKVSHCYDYRTPQGTNYVIPRGRSGQVILGGTFDARKTDTLVPDADVTRAILKKCAELAPDLLPDHVDPKDPDAWVTLDVLSNNIGVRPAREGGVRVELDKPMSIDGREVGIIHAYGIGTCSTYDSGPAGYQASYGVASEVVDLVTQYESASKPSAKL
ncbi:D-amino-acid oxidase [Malassezia yamatoensis]|uniref:D-amino-acid oxidase n=1 Tax=Malassezia yamatoensis TaxID=253288 RepID=A0AAJ5YX91_9BASI|nr:D-amino-acid oxidase [Malassezia yamatoensis]